MSSSDDQLRTILDSIPTLVWSANADGAANFFNRRWLDYTGLSAEQARDWGWTLAIHPDDRICLVDYWRSVLPSGQSGEIEARLRRFDGAYRWFLFRGTPLRDPLGTIVQWCGTNTDIDDRKRAEEALRASELDFRLILDSIPGLVATMTAEGEVEFVTQRILDYTGRTLEQLKDWAPLIHEDDLAVVSTSWKRSIETGHPYEIEHRIRGADGVYRWFHVRGIARRNAEGRPIRWYHLLSDINERKNAEEKLRRSELDLLEAQRLTHTGNFKLDLSSGTVTASPELLRRFGIRPDEDTSLPDFWFNRIHPEDRKRVRELFERCVIEKSHYEADYRIVVPDGTIRHHHSFGHPILNKSGDVVEFVGTTMDVTEQWQARAELEKANLALQASERELSLIIETMPGLVWCASPDGKLTDMNQRILDYLGASADALTQGGWVNFVHPDDRAFVLGAWAQAVASGESFEVQNRLRRADGVYRWVHSLSQLGRDDEGRATCWYGLLIDIDDRKNMEEALRRTERRLSRAAQAATVGELAAAIAHEVNQPLAAVVVNGQACLRWLSAQPPNLEEARETVERIVRDGKNAGNVVKRIRALFKQAALEKVSLDLNEIVGEVLQLLRSETARRRVAVALDLEHDMPSVVADRIQLQQLVFNLLLNGLEAMDPVPDHLRALHVRSTRDSPETVLLEIHDTGVGLKDPDRVFEAFFSTKEKGMGMGLAICRSIAEAHNGRLWAAPGDGSGTTFYFRLPFQPAEASGEGRLERKSLSG